MSGFGFRFGFGFGFGKLVENLAGFDCVGWGKIVCFWLIFLWRFGVGIGFWSGFQGEFEAFVCFLGLFVAESLIFRRFWPFFGKERRVGSVIAGLWVGFPGFRCSLCLVFLFGLLGCFVVVGNALVVVPVFARFRSIVGLVLLGLGCIVVFFQFLGCFVGFFLVIVVIFVGFRIGFGLIVVFRWLFLGVGFVIVVFLGNFGFLFLWFGSVFRLILLFFTGILLFARCILGFLIFAGGVVGVGRVGLRLGRFCVGGRRVGGGGLGILVCIGLIVVDGLEVVGANLVFFAGFLRFFAGGCLLGREESVFFLVFRCFLLFFAGVGLRVLWFFGCFLWEFRRIWQIFEGIGSRIALLGSKIGQSWTIWEALSGCWFSLSCLLAKVKLG